MKMILEDGRQFDTDRPIDISIPLRFNGPQPNAYGVEPASSAACEYGSLVGDTRRGGSCNFERYSFIPHCSGTHTECVGHITDERISVRDCLSDAFIKAVLISVKGVKPDATDERYSIPFDRGDRLITADAILSALNWAEPSGVSLGAGHAIIVRTLPNDDSKLTRQYGSSNIPPYFTTEAVMLMASLGFDHLLVDLPSIDRLFDEGKLANHRVFWNVEHENRSVDSRTRLKSTVTELIYVPGSVADGEYLLNLQIAPFASDCSPSRPLLFEYEDRKG